MNWLTVASFCILFHRPFLILDVYFTYSIKFYNTRYLSYATYKLLYYTAKTNTMENKNLLQLHSLNIEDEFFKKTKKELKVYLKLDVVNFQKEAIKFAPFIKSLIKGEFDLGQWIHL